MFCTRRRLVQEFLHLHLVTFASLALALVGVAPPGRIVATATGVCGNVSGDDDGTGMATATAIG